MSIIRRTIHPVVRVLDEAKGIVEYVASDESLDSYNEIVRANGAQFNRFQKNAPFVDSHDYSTIGRLLGKVIDFRVRGRQVVETVQWAINMGPEKTLADWGFQMTLGGFLKAVSIGFQPLSMARPGDEEFQAAMEDMEVPTGTDVRVIYLAWEQMELSACVIGANPNAVAQIEKAWQAGVVTDSAISQFSRLDKNFARAFEQRSHAPRTYSLGAGSHDRLKAIAAKLDPQPTTATTMKTPPPDYSVDFEQISRDAQEEFKHLELLRGKGTEAEQRAAVSRAFRAVAMEKRASFGDPIARHLEANPERRYLWNGLARYLGGGKLPVHSPEYKAVQRCLAAARAVSGINLQDQFGTGLLEAIPIADDIYDLLPEYGAFKSLGLRKLVGAYTRYANVTGYQTAVFITPSQQGITTIPDDVNLTGNSTLAQANTIASLLTVSRDWIGDLKLDYSEAIINRFVQSFAARIDWGCFQGNGNDDQTNGLNVGLAIDPTISAYKIPTRTGANQVQGINRGDLLNAIDLVDPSVFQRSDTQPPRWYISPAFLTQLMQLNDGAAPNYLLKTPAETHGEWTLLGFPVTWAGQAPAVNAPNAVVAFFGGPDAFLVALQDKFELSKSDFGPRQPNIQFRAIGRGKSGIRFSKGFVRLQLSN